MKQILLLICFSLIFTGFIMSPTNQDNHPSRAEQLVNSTLAKTSEIIQKKYNIKPSGAGAAMPGGPIQELTLCFDTKYPYNKAELRKLLIHTAKELLYQINTNNEIHQFLKIKPFTIRNIQIIIYNQDK